MNRKKIGFPLLAALSLLAAAPAPERGADADAVARVRAEVARLERALEAKDSRNPDWKEVGPGVAAALQRTRKALDAGYLYRGLEELATARLPFRITEISQTVPAASMSRLDADLRRARVELAAYNREARAPRQAARPAALRALAEALASRAQGLLDASRPYGAASGPDAGVNVLAQARATAELSGFCSSLPAARPGAPLPLRSWEPELQRLQKQVDDAFQPPRSIELHPQFIRLNATLKAARELDGERLFAGALYRYLDAVQQLAALEAAAVPDAAGQARLRAELAARTAEAGRSRGDDSVLRLFLERALFATGGGAAPGADDWKQAAAIAERVVPAYRAVLAGPPPAEKVAAARPVTVTLVRWPFT